MKIFIFFFKFIPYRLQDAVVFTNGYLTFYLKVLHWIWSFGESNMTMSIESSIVFLVLEELNWRIKFHHNLETLLIGWQFEKAHRGRLVHTVEDQASPSSNILHSFTPYDDQVVWPCRINLKSLSNTIDKIFGQCLKNLI